MFFRFLKEDVNEKKFTTYLNFTKVGRRRYGREGFPPISVTFA